MDLAFFLDNNWEIETQVKRYIVEIMAVVLGGQYSLCFRRR